MQSNGRSRQPRKQGWLSAIVRIVRDNQMGSALVTMLLVLAVLLCYVGVYAKVTKNGYYRASQLSRLRDARVENQRLQADLQSLRRPDRLAEMARQAGMQPGEEFDYIVGAPAIVVAQASRE